ncbi:MAG TPA: ATP-binding protein [Bryobacteraceae bacterium]|jgi:heavy metal sensor kinase|nr:ATP-binding protein [Bryobacteraceae bacterium]
MNLRELPVRTRLTVWYTAVLSLGLIAFSLFVWLTLRHLLYTDLQTALENQARGFEEYLHIEERGHAPNLIHEMDEFSKSMPQEHVLTVFDASGRVLYNNGRRRWKHKHELTTTRSIALERGPVRAELAVSDQSAAHAVSLLGWLLALAVPVFVMVAAGGGYWLSGKALAPVDRITERARTIGVRNLSARLEVPATRDELQRLTETWNGMLARLEAAVTRISRFTADASHELRTPVAIIRLAAENALRKPRPEAEYRAALEKIQRESESMTQLIEDLLFLARADAEEDVPTLELVELRTLVDNVCSDLAPLSAAKEIRLECALPPASIRVAGRAADLRRMLVILLDNAIKYTPAGGAIRVALEHENDRVTLRVEDSGIGIPEEARSRVFQRFFRVDSSRSKDSGGFGLGLAIAQAIIERHNASIELQSKPAGGCVFQVSLPLAA